jgi:hypothetical protein
MREFPGFTASNYHVNSQIFNRLRKHMEKLLIALKNIKFNHEEMEKRRLTIVEAIENKISIPSDLYDLYIINQVVPGVLDDESVKKIEAWMDSK